MTTQHVKRKTKHTVPSQHTHAAAVGACQHCCAAHCLPTNQQCCAAIECCRSPLKSWSSPRFAVMPVSPDTSVMPSSLSAPPLATISAVMVTLR